MFNKDILQAIGKLKLETIEQQILIKKQNKRLRKIENMLQSYHNKLKELFELIHPTDPIRPENLEEIKKLEGIQRQLDDQIGTVINEPVGTD